MGAWAAWGQTNHVAVSLGDGSEVRGTLEAEALPIQTGFGRISVPWSQIRMLAFEAEHETAELRLANGDRLTGVPLIEGFPLVTVFGRFVIGTSLVDSVVRMAETGAAGLVLWNTLGSRDEIEHSRVGPDGACLGGAFVEGVEGKAWEVPFSEDFRVTFPGSVQQWDTGCVEFWARFTGFPEALSDGKNPALVWSEVFLIHVNGNDGHGGGGLCAAVSSLGNMSTGRFGSWTYARALNGGRPDQWHHYALSWDRDGIEGLPGGTPAVMALFLDGQPVATLSADKAMPRPEGERAPVGGTVGLMLNQNLRQGRIAYDELKVWTRARAEFGDALRP